MVENSFYFFSAPFSIAFFDILVIPGEKANCIICKLWQLAVSRTRDASAASQLTTGL